MKHSFKKSMSVFLAVLLLFAVFAPASAAAEEEYPIVYVVGMGSRIVDKNGNEISAAGVDKDYVFNAAKDVLRQIPLDRNNKEGWNKYCDTLYSYFSPLYDTVRLDKNGEASDGSYSPFNYSWATVKHSDFKAEDYSFYYDWRVSPYETAAKLSVYIDTVRRVTGKSKVTLLGRCMGSCIIAAYLQMTENVEQKVSNVILYAPTLGGTALLGSIFSGQIKIDPDALDRYLSYYSGRETIFEDSALESLVVSAVSLAKYLKVLGFGTDIIQNIYDNVADNIVPRLVLTSYGSYPAFWAMIGTDCYESARNFIFKGKEQEYAKLIEKTDRFYYNITARLPEFIDELIDNGISVSYIAKYNFEFIPVFDGCDVQSDGLVELSTLSGGATSARAGETLSDAYIENAKKNGTDKYISADKIVDASTCRFPDRTWFIKDMEHAIMPECVNPLIERISRGNGSYTVWSDSEYPQYMTYNSETDTMLPGVTLQGEIVTPPKDFISAILKFFTSFFRWFKDAYKKIFNK